MLLKSKTMIKNLALLGLALLLTSCSKETGEVYMTSIDKTWNKKKEQKLAFEINDAQNPKNLTFVVRNNNDYPFSNIRFIVNFKNIKTKKIETDTLNYILAKPNGEWLGKGFGETKEILFQYRANYKFPENGSYEIGVTQAMRKDELPGIEDIGIKIEPAKP